jgi:hypothetical protein
VFDSYTRFKPIRAYPATFVSGKDKTRNNEDKNNVTGSESRKKEKEINTYF